MFILIVFSHTCPHQFTLPVTINQFIRYYCYSHNLLRFCHCSCKTFDKLTLSYKERCHKSPNVVFLSALIWWCILSLSTSSFSPFIDYIFSSVFSLCLCCIYLSRLSPHCCLNICLNISFIRKSDFFLVYAFQTIPYIRLSYM